MGELTKYQSLKQMLSADNTKKRFEEMLGKKAAGFISSVLQVVGNNSYLQNADPASVMTSAAIAASLDLPINPNLGYAAIIPYNDKGKGQVAQFQIMTKGFNQLAIRSGQYLAINNAIVYEGQLVKQDPFKGDYVFDFDSKKSDNIIGYVAYFRLINGFEKYYYMTVDEVTKHGLKYSQTFRKGYGMWKDNFDDMALKTVLKMLLSKYGYLSIELQRAVQFDQSTVVPKTDDATDIENADVVYVDNEPASKADELKMIVENSNGQSND